MTEKVSLIYNEIYGLFQINSPFAVYRLPETDKLYLIVPKNVKRLESLEEIYNMNGFVLAPFDICSGKHNILFLEEKEIKCFIMENSDMSGFLIEQPDISGLQHDCCLKSRYADSFSVFADAVRNGNLQKLVLARCMTFEKPETKTVLNMFFRALRAYTSSFVYMGFVPDTGLWLGASPELLLEENRSSCRTVALAGTQSLSEWQNSQEWSAKNIEEQKLVADYIASVLESMGIMYEKGKTETVVAGNVVHLNTCFSFKIPDRKLLGRFLSVLHPTPAMCGLPKDAAFDFILENENFDREYYSGFIGPVDADKGCNLFVNIRCLQVNDKGMKVYAGGGILPESVMESEYEETERKMRTLLDIY